MLAAENISAGYPHHPVLQNISLELTKGVLVALVGPNGGGKTTLLRVLSGFLAPTIGIVTLDGKDMATIPRRVVARSIAFAPQDENPVFAFNVRDVVRMGRVPYQAGWSQSPLDEQLVVSAMQDTDTLALAERPITSLSGGERRRAIIARALAQNGEIMLMDEPLAHLDIGHQYAVLRLIRLLARTRVVVCAIHDLNLAAEYADRMVMLARGEVVADGTPEDVIETDLLESVYSTRVVVIPSPTSGRPMVLPMPR